SIVSMIDGLGSCFGALSDLINSIIFFERRINGTKIEMTKNSTINEPNVNKLHRLENKNIMSLQLLIHFLQLKESALQIMYLVIHLQLLQIFLKLYFLKIP